MEEGRIFIKGKIDWGDLSEPEMWQNRHLPGKQEIVSKNTRIQLLTKQSTPQSFISRLTRGGFLFGYKKPLSPTPDFHNPPKDQHFLIFQVDFPEMRFRIRTNPGNFPGLFMYMKDGCLHFSSSLTSLLPKKAELSGNTNIDSDEFIHRLGANGTDKHKTLFRGIRRTAGSEIWTFDYLGLSCRELGDDKDAKEHVPLIPQLNQIIKELSERVN